MVIQERGASARDIDTVLRGAGFRMGPCELMDLIGHDVNFAVTESMFHAYYSDRRFGPSGLMVDRLGEMAGAPIRRRCFRKNANVQGHEYCKRE